MTEQGEDITEQRWQRWMAAVGRSLTPDVQLLLEDEAASLRAAQDLAKLLHSGDQLALSGDLGAGKTSFTRGIALGLGLPDAVASPTFTLVMEHLAAEPQELTLFHFDLYRLNSADDFVEAGLEEYFSRDAVAVMEWPERILELLDEDAWLLRFRIIALGRAEEPGSENMVARCLRIYAPRDRGGLVAEAFAGWPGPSPAATEEDTI